MAPVTAGPVIVVSVTAVLFKPGGRALLVDMQPHERAEYRAQMGHVWLGFSSAQIERWLAEAGLVDARVRELAPSPEVKGPPLFAAVAHKPPGAPKRRSVRISERSHDRKEAP